MVYFRGLCGILNVFAMELEGKCMTKEETKKLTRETRRDIVNIIMVIISCILYCLLIYGMVLMFRQFSTMVSSMNDYISCVDYV